MTRQKGKREEEKLIAWLGYTIALLHRTIPLHDSGSKDFIYSDDSDTDKLHPYERYYTLLFALIFDIYSDLISSVCNVSPLPFTSHSYRSWTRSSSFHTYRRETSMRYIYLSLIPSERPRRM